MRGLGCLLPPSLYYANKDVPLDEVRFAGEGCLVNFLVYLRIGFSQRMSKIYGNRKF